jgi:hypothetical protein
MQRRKFIASVGSIAAAGAAAMGTGAFTSVSADRSVSVNVAGDDAALLALDASSGANSAYATQTGSGEVTVEIDDTDDVYADASGVNANATTKIFELFEIKNQGTQPVAVHVPPESVTPESAGAVDGDYSGFYMDPQFSNRPNGGYNGPVSGTVVYYLSGGEPDFTAAAERAFNNSGGRDNYVLTAGESMDFGLHLDTEDGSWDQTIDYTIRADAGQVPDDF